MEQISYFEGQPSRCEGAENKSLKMCGISSVGN
jgi:hypothetical protein